MLAILRWSLGFVLLLALASPAWALWWCHPKKCYVCPPPCPAPSGPAAGKSQADTTPAPDGKKAADTTLPPPKADTTFGDPNRARVQADLDYWNAFLGRGPCPDGRGPDVKGSAPTTDFVKNLQDAFDTDKKAEPNAEWKARRGALSNAYKQAAEAIAKGSYRKGKETVTVETGEDVSLAIKYYRDAVLLDAETMFKSSLAVAKTFLAAKVGVKRGDALDDAKRKQVAAVLNELADAFDQVQ